MLLQALSILSTHSQCPVFVLIPADMQQTNMVIIILTFDYNGNEDDAKCDDKEHTKVSERKKRQKQEREKSNERNLMLVIKF